MNYEPRTTIYEPRAINHEPNTMTTTPEHDAKIAKMTFASVYPHYVTKVQKIEDISTPLTQQVRYLDKLVDELSKGKKMEKILRNA